MREKKEVLVITFATTSQAMAMEDCCRKNQMQGRLIPLPGEISAGCGLCFRTEQVDEEQWCSFLEKEHLNYDKIRKMRL